MLDLPKRPIAITRVEKVAVKCLKKGGWLLQKPTKGPLIFGKACRQQGTPG